MLTSTQNAGNVLQLCIVTPPLLGSSLRGSNWDFRLDWPCQ